MTADRVSPARSCAGIRPLLQALVHRRLAPDDTAVVEQHLGACEGCCEVMGRLLVDDILAANTPLPEPVRKPPPGWYDAFLRENASPFSTWWSAVREALGGTDSELRDWGARRQAAVWRAIDAMTNERPAAPASTLTLPPPGSPWALEAEVEVMSSATEWQRRVTLHVTAPPGITASGHLRLRAETLEPGLDGALLVCTVLLPDVPAVSFSGTFAAGAGRTSEVSIDEADVARPGASRFLPRQSYRLAILNDGH